MDRIGSDRCRTGHGLNVIRLALVTSIVLSPFSCTFAWSADGTVVFSGERKLNNLTSDLLEVSSITKSENSFPFTRSRDGWIFLSAAYAGKGRIYVGLEGDPERGRMIVLDANSSGTDEAMSYVSKGKNQIRVRCDGDITVSKLVVKAIPELIHCGLGFNPAIKSYGLYDMEFLKKDILPNVNTLIVPHNVELSPSVIDGWHREGKRFIAEVGINSQAKTGEDHFRYWTGFLERAPFLDGIIINEFGMNKPSSKPSSARQKREQQRHQLYEQAFTKMRADTRYRNKMVYAYFGGSGNRVNYEDTGTTFVRHILDCDYRIALERYLFERSSEKASKAALETFIDGIADWNANEPGVKEKMIIAFGLFSMPPGSINKQPNVDYHVWMDQQMNVVANHPTMAGIGGLEWWTSLMADEETVRFVGKLYRHYAIEGKTEMLTHDPLFLTHVVNADFERGAEGWTLHAAEGESIKAKSFPRYGRIEGRYMGLGRPADPEHIGDTFLWMKRSEKGPNTFSQIVKNLEPGRLYSLKMFSCDYQDLLKPKVKKVEQVNKFLGNVVLEGVDVDTRKSFSEMYASNPEPRIPVWITYHWKVFRAKGTRAKLTVSDWPLENQPTRPFGLEQIFNFVELQPYHE
jgi:hypothetical protein